MQKHYPLSLHPHKFTPIEKQIVLLKSRHQCDGEWVWAALDITKHIWVKSQSCLWISCHNFSIVWFLCIVSETSTVFARTPKQPLLPSEKGQEMWIPAPDSSGKLGASEAPSWCPCPGKSLARLGGDCQVPGDPAGRQLHQRGCHQLHCRNANKSPLFFLVICFCTE